MTNRTLIGYSLIALLIAAPFVFLWLRALVRRKALRVSNEPVYVRE